MSELEGRGGCTASGPVVLGEKELLLETPAQDTPLVEKIPTQMEKNLGSS